MMGLSPVPLVRAIFHFSLENPLVVSVAQLGRVGEVTEIFSKVGRVIDIFSKVGRVTEIFPKLFESQNLFLAKKLS